MSQLPDESDGSSAGSSADHSFSESEARRAYLQTLGEALRPLADPVEIQNMAMQVLGRQLGVSLARYYEADESGRYLSSHGGYADGRRAVLGRIRMDDFGLYLGENLRAGRTLAVADVSADPRVSVEQLKSYDAFGFRAYVGIPLVKGGRLVAALGLHQATRRDWSATDLVIASETAERTWAAVERSRVEAALSEKEALLAAQKEAFQAEMDDAPLKTSLGILIDALVRMADDGRRCAFYIVDENKQSLRHVVGLPEDDARALDGFATSPDSLPCALAVASGQPMADARRPAGRAMAALDLAGAAARLPGLLVLSARDHQRQAGRLPRLLLRAAARGAAFGPRARRGRHQDGGHDHLAPPGERATHACRGGAARKRDEVPRFVRIHRLGLLRDRSPLRRPWPAGRLRLPGNQPGLHRAHRPGRRHRQASA